MRRVVKTIGLRILRPLAATCGRLTTPLGRLWNQARLTAACVDGVDPSVVLLGGAEVHGSGRIRIAAGAFLYRDLHLETQGGGSIDIGEDVVLSRGVHIVAFAAVRIGRGTMIGEYTSIRDANHRTTAGSLRASGHVARPIEIGENVWVGRGAAVLAGVRIGDGAVIGANAVVTHDVPPGVRVGGVPARPLRNRGER